MKTSGYTWRTRKFLHSRPLAAIMVDQELAAGSSTQPCNNVIRNHARLVVVTSPSHVRRATCNEHMALFTDHRKSRCASQRYCRYSEFSCCLSRAPADEIPAFLALFSFRRPLSLLFSLLFSPLILSPFPLFSFLLFFSSAIYATRCSHSFAFLRFT